MMDVCVTKKKDDVCNKSNFKLSCIVEDVTTFMPKDGVQSFSLGSLDKWTYLHSDVFVPVIH